MVILDTCIKSDVDKNTLDAFLYGQISGTYKLYKELDSNNLSIRFDNDEDATFFKLKALDKVFVEKFNKASVNMRSMFDSVCFQHHAIGRAMRSNHISDSTVTSPTKKPIDWLASHTL